jgi:hypothetical protein
VTDKQIFLKIKNTIIQTISQSEIQSGNIQLSIYFDRSVHYNFRVQSTRADQKSCGTGTELSKFTPRGEQKQTRNTTDFLKKTVSKKFFENYLKMDRRRSDN